MAHLQGVELAPANLTAADLDWVAQLDWLRQRFQGLPMKDDCPGT